MWRGLCVIGGGGASVWTAAVQGESAGHRGSHADNLLKALNRELVHSIEWQAIASGCFLELVRST